MSINLKEELQIYVQKINDYLQAKPYPKKSFLSREEIARSNTLDQFRFIVGISLKSNHITQVQTETASARFLKSCLIHCINQLGNDDIDMSHGALEAIERLKADIKPFVKNPLLEGIDNVLKGTASTIRLQK